MSSGDEKYGGWCVNWAAFDVPTLWNMLQHEGSTDAYQQVVTWQNTHDLLGYHMGELQTCRQELAAKWPPTRSPAAGVFLDYVDNLLGSMKQMSQDALANGEALSGVNQALVKARNEISTLHEQWQKYQHKEDNPPTILGLIDLSPDVPDDWRKQLTEQAAKHMAESDKTVFENTSKMAVPVPFDPNPTRSDEITPFGNEQSGSGSGSGGRIGGASGPGSSWATPPHIPPPPVSEPPPPGATIGSDATTGPVLSGGAAPPGTVITPPPPPPPPPPPITPPPGGYPPPVIGPLGPLGPGLTPGPVGGKGPTPRPVAGPGGAGRGPFGEAVAHGRSMVAPGGVIGGAAPPAGRAAPTGGPRAKPVGGVIGGQAGGAAQAGGMHGAAARRRSGTGQDANHFDPDDPWAVAEGGPSVLEPDTTPQRHEPGPGVIGIDR